MLARILELGLIALLCAPVAARADGEVTCGQTVDRQTARLTGDCTGSIKVVAGTLEMQGFTINGTGLAAIECQGRCRIEGPGAIVSMGSTFGISGDGSIRATDLTISGHEAAGVNAGALGRARLDGVTITGNGVGVSAPRLKITDCQINDNEGTGVVATWRGVRLLRTHVKRNGGDGVSVSMTSGEADRATVLYSTVSDNGHFGVVAKNIVTKRAVLRQNGDDPACGDTEPCVDIGSVYFPHLRESACDESMQIPEEFSGSIPFGDTWGVCSFDP